MDKLYRIIWIDDDYENMSEFIGYCEDYGMEIHPYKTRTEGLNAFEKEQYAWDAIIVDAWCYDESLEESPTDEGLVGFYYKLKDRIPTFVFTGNEELKKDSRFMRDTSAYVKFVDDNKLIEDILDRIKNREETIVRNEYREVIDIIDSRFLCYAGKTKEILIKSLLALHVKDRKANFEMHFNNLRHILEYICFVLKSYGLAPEEYFSEKGPDVLRCFNYLTYNQEKSKKHIQGVDIYYKYDNDCRETLLPSYFSPLIKFLVYKFNEESHAHTSSSMEYLYYGCCLQLCEIIIQIDAILKKHPNEKENISKARYTNYEGQIIVPEKDCNGNWHYEDCLITLREYHGNNQLRLRDIVLNNKAKTRNIYKYYAQYDIIKKV